MKRAGLEISRAGLGSSVYFTAKTIGTFLGAFLLLKTKPFRFLRISLVIAILAFVPLMLGGTLWSMLAAIFVIGLACANVFSILFSLALNKLPERSNEISALMIMGVSGGAVILPIQGVVNDGFGLMASLSVLLFCLILNLLFTQNLKKMDHKNKNIVLTLDAGGTSFVFSAIADNREVVDPICLPAYPDDLERCLPPSSRDSGRWRICCILHPWPSASLFRSCRLHPWHNRRPSQFPGF